MAKLKLESNYIFKKAPWLTWGELNFGLKHGYIDENEISNYVCKKLTNSDPQEAFDIASIDITEKYLVGDLLQSLILKSQHNDSHPEKIWLYLLLSFVFENKEGFDDPLETAEEIYSDFDYPEEISSLIRYMPLPEGQEGSEEQLFKNWESKLSDYESFFSQQRTTPKT